MLRKLINNSKYLSKTTFKRHFTAPVSEFYKTVKGGSFIGVYPIQDIQQPTSNPAEIKTNAVRGGTVTIAHTPGDHSEFAGKNLIVTADHVVNKTNSPESRYYVWGNEGIQVGNTVKPLFRPIELKLLSGDAAFYKDHDICVLEYSDECSHLVSKDVVKGEEGSIEVEVYPKNGSVFGRLYTLMDILFYDMNSGFGKTYLGGTIDVKHPAIYHEYVRLIERLVESRDLFALCHGKEYENLTRSSDSGMPLINTFHQLIGMHHGVISYDAAIIPLWFKIPFFNPQLFDFRYFFQFASTYETIHKALGYSPVQLNAPHGNDFPPFDNTTTTIGFEGQSNYCWGVLADTIDEKVLKQSNIVPVPDSNLKDFMFGETEPIPYHKGNIIAFSKGKVNIAHDVETKDTEPNK